MTALGRAVQDEGHAVQVILPKYDCLDYKQIKVGLSAGFAVGGGGTCVCFWVGGRRVGAGAGVRVRISTLT